MVFTRLSVQEKEAFFGLLDEYFQSRPEIFEKNGPGLAGTGISTTAAASVVQRAIAANAQTGSHPSTTKSNNPYAASMQNLDIGQAVTIGRVSAASLAFSTPPPSSQSQSSTELPPPSLPRRMFSNAPAIAHTGGIDQTPGTEVDKLVTKKGSVFSAFKKPQPTGVVTIPPAFVAPKNTFGPPPVRRVTSETSGNGPAGGAAPRLRPVPQPEPEPEEVEGEWAEVLYDYNSEDPSDLAINAGTRVLVTDKSSEDWWTGKINGREGLFPASYVKLL